MWEDVPGAYPSAMFDIANYGAASRYAVLNFTAARKSVEDMRRSATSKAGVGQHPRVEHGGRRGDELPGGFRRRRDPVSVQPRPRAGHQVALRPGRGQPAKQAVADRVAKATGEMNFQGAGLRTNGPVSRRQGPLGRRDAGAATCAAKTWRSSEKATSIRIRFAVPEADGDYAVFVEQTWLSNRAISDKGPEGFTSTSPRRPRRMPRSTG